MRRLVIALVVVAGLPLAAADIGPDKGTLVIVGGNMQDPAIVKRFIDLAGGPGAPIVIVPTAGDADDYDQYYSGLKQWRENGAANLTVVHTRDRKVADTEAFVKPIRAARGVFFAGGRQWRLADSYLNTLAHKELTALLARGGVIGGGHVGGGAGRLVGALGPAVVPGVGTAVAGDGSRNRHRAAGDIDGGRDRVGGR